MLNVMTNHHARKATRPAFTSAIQVAQYLDNNTLPDQVKHLPTPPLIARTKHCFWVQPELSPYPGIASFLVNTDSSPTGIADIGNADLAKALDCYLINDRIVVGSREDGPVFPVLKPIIEGLHQPLNLSGARYVGRIEAAM
jgi:hypothetical protein